MQVEHVDPLIGAVLADRYRICELMSRGGFGKVYRAVHVTIGRPLAVKVMSVAGHGHDDEELQRRFLSEARATSQIGHPNVIDISDFGYTTSGLAFYVMELLTGEDLAQVLRRCGPLPWSRLGPMVLQICGALGAAHRLGIVHRDIKPANCFCVEIEDNPDFIKVLDFGIAKSYAPPPGMEGPETATQTLMGTPAYMAPEFARGAPADERSDIYALGVVMYELATGARPIHGVDFVNFLYNHCHTEPVPPRSLAPDLPEAAERIILRALCKLPDARPQSMRELQEEVRRSLSMPVSGAVTPGLATRHTAPLPVLSLHGTDTTLAALAVAPGVAVVPAIAVEARAAEVPVIPVERPAMPMELAPDAPTALSRRPRRGLALTLTALAVTIVVWLGVVRHGVIEDTQAPATSLTPSAAGPRPEVFVADPLPFVGPPDSGLLPDSGSLPALVPEPELPTKEPSTKDPPTRSIEPTKSVKKSAPAPAPIPAFNEAKARAVLTRAVTAGADACYAKHDAPKGFVFVVSVTVSADGGVKPSGSANSALRKCLIDVVPDKISLGPTRTGGAFQYTFKKL